MGALVEISDLHKNFGQFTAVNGISFNVDRGEVLGFLGPNGAGKSTTMKMITGFLTPTSGKIRVGGDDLEQAPVKVKSRIGYLPEGAPAYQDMTPLEFLHFIAEIRGFSGAQKQQKIDEIIDKVNISQVTHQPIETLSKGFKRRVGLAQAILHDPEVLILDEPTDGLDPNQKHEVRTLIKAMAAEKAIILSTHILEEVDAVCTRAMIIAAGKLIADGTPEELTARSAWHNAVTLKVTGQPRDTVVRELTALPAVANVETLEESGQRVTVKITPREHRLVVADIGTFIHERNWSVEELHVHKGRLDDVFRDITIKQQAIS